MRPESSPKFADKLKLAASLAAESARTFDGGLTLAEVS